MRQVSVGCATKTLQLWQLRLDLKYIFLFSSKQFPLNFKIGLLLSLYFYDFTGFCKRWWEKWKLILGNTLTFQLVKNSCVWDRKKMTKPLARLPTYRLFLFEFPFTADLERKTEVTLRPIQYWLGFTLTRPGRGSVLRTYPPWWEPWWGFLGRSAWWRALPRPHPSRPWPAGCSWHKQSRAPAFYPPADTHSDGGRLASFR